MWLQCGLLIFGVLVFALAIRIMIEDMWFNAVLKINYFDELLTTLKEMEKGYDKVKNTVNVSVVSDDFIKVDITNTGTTSLTIERVK